MKLADVVKDVRTLLRRSKRLVREAEKTLADVERQARELGKRAGKP